MIDVAVAGESVEGNEMAFAVDFELDIRSRCIGEVRSASWVVMAIGPGTQALFYPSSIVEICLRESRS